MDYRFSQRISALQPSAIREILKATSDPKVISFAAGNPSEQAFPVAQMNRIINDIMSQTPLLALQYSVSEGYGPLRQAVADFVSRRESLALSAGRDHQGFSCRADQCLIVSGAQQALDFSVRCLCDEGDTVICESPSFIGALNSFRSYNVNLVGVELQEDGMDISRLEQALEQNPRARFIYVIPNFQNPAGITTSLAKRQAIYELARHYDVMIVEDNPYGELRFRGPLPSLKAMDTDERVIYCGSFSKTIAPGLRVAYVIAPSPVIAKFTVAKQCADVHTNMLSQIACCRFLTEEDTEAHFADLRALYKAKCDLMLAGIDAHFPKFVTCTRPEGGLFLWVTLPETADMPAFCRRAAEGGVAVVPGHAFNVESKASSSSFRLNFSTPGDDQIREGIALLGELLAGVDC